MTRNLLGFFLLLTLVVVLVAHGLLVRGLFQRGPRGRAVLGMLLPPLALLDGWVLGMRKRVSAALLALVLHAVLVAISRATGG